MVWDFKGIKLTAWFGDNHFPVVVQEDDIDGEHIVAFAEEDDPGQ